jgi:FdhE protein
MMPVLSAHAHALLPMVPQEEWYKRYCPVCGGEPDFAFLDKERGSRWLLCSRCNAHWLFIRLACPYCDNQDMNTLAYFTDDESLYRLYVCEKCQRYIKAIDIRKTETEVLLPLERIHTLDLDRQAYESNYKAT